MAIWRILVLGNTAVMTGRRRAAALPAVAWPLIGSLLAAQRHARNRHALAAELWPDASEDAARQCLASALWRIRKRLPCFDDVFHVEGDQIALRPGPNVWIDALAMARRAVHALDDPGSLDSAAARVKLRRGLAAYAGDLLAMCDLESIMIERERLRALYLDAGFQLARVCARHCQWQDTLEICRALCEVEPLREDAQRLLIQAYMEVGSRGLALQQYNDFRTYLERELQVSPMAETRALVSRLTSSGEPLVSEPPAIPMLSPHRALVLARSRMASTLRLLDRLIAESR
ncbi:BTAD domain-containing putative transcriptional regulator [Sphingomonas sp. R86521]|uniref:AfsR/SARP family transcriptional regulator n=1 Tax=Sphingomonas sp. R86521 TaxID=3093860 RepID=UPI0036D3A29B